MGTISAALENSCVMATCAENQDWRERVKELRSRLLRPERLSEEEFYSLKSELYAIERLLDLQPKS